jgi:hypothetical protein
MGDYLQWGSKPPGEMLHLTRRLEPTPCRRSDRPSGHRRLAPGGDQIRPGKRPAPRSAIRPAARSPPLLVNGSQVVASRIVQLGRVRNRYRSTCNTRWRSVARRACTWGWARALRELARICPDQGRRRRPTHLEGSTAARPLRRAGCAKIAQSAHRRGIRQQPTTDLATDIGIQPRPQLPIRSLARMPLAPRPPRRRQRRAQAAAAAGLLPGTPARAIGGRDSRQDIAHARRGHARITVRLPRGAGTAAHQRAAAPGTTAAQRSRPT